MTTKMGVRSESGERFDFYGVCRCDAIKQGKCKQCSACPDCEYYKHEEVKPDITAVYRHRPGIR